MLVDGLSAAGFEIRESRPWMENLKGKIMGTELTNIDTIKDKVRERIQIEFVQLIPKEAWDALVSKEVEWFMNYKDQWTTDRSPSPLRQIVRKELEKIFIGQVKTTLMKMEITSWDDDGKPMASEAVKKMVKEIAPELWEIAVAGVIQRAVEGLRQQIQQL